MILAYEREKVFDFVGTQEAKINFLQTFPSVAKFNKGYSVFYSAGVYQLMDGPPLLVLPWFLKDSDFLDSEESSRINNFFDVIKEIKALRELMTDLSLDKKSSALDLVVHSYLLNQSRLVENILRYNFQLSEENEIESIRGRWELRTDLKKGPRPLKFTCNYSSLTRDVPILVLVKSSTRLLSKILRANKNQEIIHSIFVSLSDVKDEEISKSLLLSARAWLRANPKFNEFASTVDFIESLVFNKSIYSEQAGLSYHFKMDKFFEELCLKLFDMISEAEVIPQSREYVLGGAVWSRDGESIFDEEIKNANQYSIPDILIESQKDFVVLECKYKPFLIPLLNDHSRMEDLSNFGRNDRNQLLSFLMSIRPRPSLASKNLFFSVIFPCREVNDFGISDLVFSSAKIHIDPVVRHLIQNKNEFNEDAMLRVKFIGLNISYCLKSLVNRTSDLANNIFSGIVSNQKVSSIEFPATKFQKVLEKRVALASMIVDKSNNDPSLGRVKLAKVFYLLDQHLNLQMQASYIREAAGPLDQRLIYNDKIGIENIGNKYSLFKTINLKRIDSEDDRVRYVKSQNLSQMVTKSKNIFFDKFELIEGMLAKLLPLKTEQSEIVATLYGCWNDLKIKNKGDITDEMIVTDFLYNWHPSKLRFENDKQRLFNALVWMRENNLEPNGLGPLTSHKEEKIPSSF